MYTSDIFETLISRYTATPTGIFSVMQYLLMHRTEIQLPVLIKNNFFYFRKNAEVDARRLYKDANIFQIYDVMSESVYLDEKQKEYFINLELETEKTYSFLIDDNVSKLKEHALKEEQTALISDMYLKENMIRSLLASKDCFFEKEPIFVSCEYNCGKANGLFQSVYNAFDVTDAMLNSWNHYGDNYQADVKAAKKHGINGICFDYPSMLDWEKDFFCESDLGFQLLCGASKNARIGKEDSIPFNIGCSIGVGILYPFVYESIQTAIRLDFNDIYFIARDGFILKDIASKIIEKNKFNVRVHYIYSSRVAWNLKEGIDDSEKIELLKSYIKQECSGNRIFMVDVQGTSATVNALATLMPKYDFTVCMYKKSISHEVINNKRKNLMVISFMNGFDSISNYVLETLTRSLEEKTVGYKKLGDKIVPDFKDEDTTLLLNYGYSEYIDGVLSGVDELLKNPNELLKEVDFISYAYTYLNYLKETKNSVILKWIGDMPFNDQRNGIEMNLFFAPELTTDQLKSYYVWNNFDYSKYAGLCLEFSLKRCKDKENLIAIYKDIGLSKKMLIKPKPRYRVKETNVKEKVVVYGAGNVGKEIYDQLNNCNKVEYLHWVDRNYLLCKAEGLPVLPIKDLQNLQYDQIIVAILNPKIAETVFVELEAIGVDKNCLYWENYSR